MRKKNGFTLIEMVLVIGLLGIVFSFGATLLTEAYRAFFLARETSLLYTEGQRALHRIARELQNAPQAHLPRRPQQP